MKIRIDKYLADMGAGSRTEIKDDIRKGLVYINGNKVKSAGEKADTLNDEVAYKENIIKYIEFEYILLNKPAGVVSATEDRKEKTVLDIIDSKRKDLFLWEDLIRIRKDFCCLPMTECLRMSFYLLKTC